MDAGSTSDWKPPPGHTASLWLATSPQTAYPSLPGGLSVDVAVVGGGIAGLTTALLVKRSGATVAVVEADRIGAGVTGHTTGKVTCAHGLIYRALIERFGVEKARQYAQANREAVEFVASLVKDEGIACDLHRDFACTYTADDRQVKSIEAEVQAAGQVGLAASYTQSLDLPFPIQAAIRYENQAYFHSRKYLLALASRIDGNGSFVFENTRARDVREGRPCEVLTERGIIKAGQVVVATHFPILNRGLFFAKMRPVRSYLLAAAVEGELPAGMYINVEEPTRTLRKHALDSGEVLLILGGENHDVGHATDTIERYRSAESFAREYFRVRSVPYRWSTQDNRPVDRVPFVGHHSLLSSRLYVATGFQGWGLSNGTAAGRILADKIAGRASPWQEVFDANRIMPLVSGRAVSMNVHVARTFIEDRLPGAKRKAAADLAPGEAALADRGGREAAAFREEQGQLHTVSPVCVHMGCKVRWNNAERSWDCPCHGSRYRYDGAVIHAPACRDLEQMP